jgi:ATP-binding cassette subfamily F protein 3
MIQVSGLSKSYGRQVLLDNVSFTVNPGERIGLVGRNGHGKTTLFRMILGEEHADEGAISIPAGYTIGHLSQHIRFSEIDILKEACLFLPAAEDGRDETYRAKSILMGLGFAEDDFKCPPSELSGGYQVRLNLAKVLIQSPNLLLLDEPTNYLDILSVRWLTRFLGNWKNELILITHDRDFMDSVTTHTMGIHRLRIRKTAGPTLKLYDQILLEEEVHEKTRVNDEKKRADIEQFINRFRAKATKARAVQSKVKLLDKRERLEKMAAIKNLDFCFNVEPFRGKWLLETSDLSFSFDQGVQTLISGLNIAISKEDRIGIIGKNGKGKTTLLNLLAGELTPTRGMINCNSKTRIAYFGQTNIDRLDSKKTAEEEILDAMPEYNRKAARSICGLMMFEGDNALKKINVLSGGEKSRILLGKLLVSPANLLLLDEPTNHLDMESIDSLIEAIDAFDGGVMIVTHSELILNALATRLIVFDGGKVSVFERGYRDFLERVGWQDESEEKASEEKNYEVRDKGTNKKELRRIRAEIINERSKTLNTIQSRIREIEAIIMRLEAGVEKDTGELLKVSEKGDWQTSADLSKAVHKAKADIDTLFNELATLTASLDEKSREFETRLEEV